MSRFLTKNMQKLEPYVPGEQPAVKYIKLNTNENPFPPSEKALKEAASEMAKSNLYPPLDGGSLRPKIAEVYGVGRENVAVANSSDEILNFIFKAFCGPDSPAAFADITYGFYPVFAGLNGADYQIIPLGDDFKLRPEDYIGIHKNIFIANPNAPTGLIISTDDIAKIASSNPDNIVVIDEAYVDFGGVSALNILRDHENLIVTRTFSKSRSLAGARIGYAFASKDIIDDLYRVIYSTNPYNLSRVSLALGYGSMCDEEYTLNNCKTIANTRDKTAEDLRKLGFTVLPSHANFLFAKSPKIGGKELYLKLKDRGILVRHFDSERIKDYLRITVGLKEDMEKLTEIISEISEERR